MVAWARRSRREPAALSGAGTIRADVEPADVNARVVGCVARQQSTTDEAAMNRMIAIVSDGLRGERDGAESVGQSTA